MIWIFTTFAFFFCFYLILIECFFLCLFGGGVGGVAVLEILANRLVLVALVFRRELWISLFNCCCYWMGSHFVLHLLHTRFWSADPCILTLHSNHYYIYVSVVELLVSSHLPTSLQFVRSSNSSLFWSPNLVDSVALQPLSGCHSYSLIRNDKATTIS